MVKKKMTKLVESKKDYLRLPFEVYYSGPLDYTSLELLSETGRIKNPNEIKGLHHEQGIAHGTTFYCGKNTGSELYSCLTGNLGEASPSWLSVVEEENMSMNYGKTHKVLADSESIDLAVQVEDEDLLSELEPTGICTGIYHLEDESPDYIILDAGGDRIMINSEGFGFNEDDEPDESLKIIDLDTLDDDLLCDCEKLSFNEKQDLWIKDVWEKYFKKPIQVKIKHYVNI